MGHEISPPLPKPAPPSWVPTPSCRFPRYPSPPSEGGGGAHCVDDLGAILAIPENSNQNFLQAN